MKKRGFIGWLRIGIHALLLRPFIMLFSGVNIIGREHIRQVNQFIIVANHNSHLDVLLLFYLLPLSDIVRTHPVADKPYFSKRKIVFRLVDLLFKPIWITRGSPDTDGDPFAHIKNRLDKGENVIIFPEGTRGSPGEIQQFKSGIGRLMTQYPDMPILPVLLSGPERALPKGSSLLLPFWNHIVVGPPQIYRGSHREITTSLHETLQSLYCSETAHRHHRRQRTSAAPTIIAFLGIDGSGKSTLSAMVAQKLSESSKTALISDELEIYDGGNRQDVQPLITEKLREAIGSYAKQAASLKSYKVPKLAELILRDRLLRDAGRWYLPGKVVMDGSPLLNMAGWAVLYKGDAIDDQTWADAIGLLAGKKINPDRERSMYNLFPEARYLKQLKLNRLSLPDVVIFLDIPPTIACERIGGRGERRQVHETEEKLTALRSAYIKVCGLVEQNWNTPVMIISGEKSREESTAEAVEFITSTLTAEGNNGIKD
jgi:1-acyl-sn-glycerol-3-phosphate acyltransferase